MTKKTATPNLKATADHKADFNPNTCTDEPQLLTEHALLLRDMIQPTKGQLTLAFLSDIVAVTMLALLAALLLAGGAK